MPINHDDRYRYESRPDPEIEGLYHDWMYHNYPEGPSWFDDIILGIEDWIRRKLEAREMRRLRRLPADRLAGEFASALIRENYVKCGTIRRVLSERILSGELPADFADRMIEAICAQRAERI